MAIVIRFKAVQFSKSMGNELFNRQQVDTLILKAGFCSMLQIARSVNIVSMLFTALAIAIDVKGVNDFNTTIWKNLRSQTHFVRNYRSFLHFRALALLYSEAID